MAIEPGTRFGSYEVAEAIGAGGMGEVYRATDTTLKREVAIKVLPRSVASDASRIARFEQEARTLASLNHPNIAHIYGLEKSDGTAALVMELVEGPTLEDRIAMGPLPGDEALGIARQIADALEAAHSRHIVHRDLKPANVKLRPDGTVKVLDFGIAKALSPESLTSEPPSPIMTTPATQVGMILGTAAYMSPEQAKGKQVDERTDIWAFGVVLYEMLTGQLAFGAEDVPTTIARVIANDTDLDSLPGTVPPAVHRTIELCLRKDPAKRVADIRDVKLALAGAFETERSPVAAAVFSAPGRWRSPAVLVGLAGVLLAIGASVTVWSVMRPEPARVMRFDVSPESGFTVTDNSRSSALSPDGQRFAYVRGGTPGVGADEIRLRDLDALESTLLVAETAIASPFFSPNGSEIGYYNTDPATLKRVSTRGGPPSVITALDAAMNGASWGDDGRIYFATREPAMGGLWMVPAVGGTAELLTTPDTAQGELDHYWPEVLPGSRGVLFTIVRADTPQIAVLDLDTGTYRSLVNGSFPRYAPTGHLLYGLDGTLWAVGFDLDRLETTGAPVPVLEGIVTKGSQSAEVALAADGSLLYIAGPALDANADATAAASELVWVDATGAETPLDAPLRAYESVQVSPDGARVAVVIEGNIWIWDGPGRLDRLTFDDGPNTAPSWLADGTELAYSSDRDGGGVFVQPSNGTGVARRLLDVPAAPHDEAADGSILYMTVPDIGVAFVDADFSIGVVPASGGSGELLIASRAFSPALSPNGRWLAYMSSESGRNEIFVRGYPNLESLQRLVSTEGGITPRWSPDGRMLYYLTTDWQSLMAAEVVSEAPFAARAPERLFSLDRLHVDFGKIYDVAPDGRFIFIRPNDDAANRLILVQNFLTELERLVPTK